MSAGEFSAAGRRYHDLVLHAEVVERGADGLASAFTTRVFASPAGEGEPIRREIPSDLYRALGKVDRRRLDVAGMIALGEALADLLLPEAARALFVRSVDRLGPGEGLRLRLRLPPALAGIPWEYLYVARAGGEKDATGFLALDPRLSIARHEALPIAADLDEAPRPRRLVVALASPAAEGYAPLDLGRERSVIEAATEDLPATRVDVVEDVTAEALVDALQGGADLFHFAGHGVFEQTGLGIRPGSVTGRGALVLADGAGGAAHVPADQVGVNLRGRGVQVVVLGACETAKRDEESAWSGVAAALMEAGIPAVVAMQFRVWDDAAIAFARALYRGLAAGLSLDEAVSIGRLQVFNLVHPRQDGFWREWGVPVLYQRAAGAVRLPAIADPDAAGAAADGLRVVAELRVAEIGPRATYVGVEAGVVEGGRIESRLTAGRSEGTVTQVDAGAVEGGSVAASGEVERLEGGAWTGVRVGRLGPSGGPSGAAPAAAAQGAGTPSGSAAPTTASSGTACASCGAGLSAGDRFCAACGTAVPERPRHCTQCGAELSAGARFCAACGAATGA